VSNPQVVSAEMAVDRIPEGARIVVSPSCGTPTSLVTALVGAAEGRNWTLASGLVFEPELIVDAVDAGTVRWRTWHPTTACERVFDQDGFGYVPLRASQVPGLLASGRFEAAVIRVTPPDRNGWFSLGPSAGYPAIAADVAGICIAEVDPSMPRTWGQSMVHSSQLDVLVESTSPMPVYKAASPDDTSRAIARNVIDLLPSEPVLQLGIGKIPEAMVHTLAEEGVGPVTFVGMGSDGMVDLADRGLLGPRPYQGPSICAPDLLGTARLMEYAHDNPDVGVYPSSIAHSAILLSGRDRLVSVNSALEVDLKGQVNAETIKGRRVTGVGGSYDFAEAATWSNGGTRVIAVPSNRIVERLGEGSAVTVPTALVDVVVTELGAVRLQGLTEKEREAGLRRISSKLQ
jgi:4-hydroxybutyrate CoA-transferase